MSDVVRVDRPTGRTLPDCGVVLIASGRRYVDFGLAAAASVRRSNPQIGIALFSDQADLDTRALVDLHGVFADGHYRSKVDHMISSPFERSLYLDTDVRVVAPLDDMFRILDRFDLAIAHAHRRNSTLTSQTWRENIPAAFPQLNSGVVLYRKGPAVDRLWREWAEHFPAAGFKKDQVTLRELLWTAEYLRWTVLPPEFNIRYRKYPQIWDREEAEPKILHYQEFHTGSASGLAPVTLANPPAPFRRT